MDVSVEEIENNIIKIIYGCKEKERRRKIFVALRKLEEDKVKYNYVKKLYRYYSTINSLGHILHPIDIPVEEDKYEIHYLCQYLDGVVSTAKSSITAVIHALGNDEPVDPFYKYLMFTHMYTPEEVKEIGHEEIYRREQEFEKELGLV